MGVSSLCFVPLFCRARRMSLLQQRRSILFLFLQEQIHGLHCPKLQNRSRWWSRRRKESCLKRQTCFNSSIDSRVSAPFLESNCTESIQTVAISLLPNAIVSPFRVNETRDSNHFQRHHGGNVKTIVTSIICRHVEDFTSKRDDDEGMLRRRRVYTHPNLQQ